MKCNFCDTETKMWLLEFENGFKLMLCTNCKSEFIKEWELYINKIILQEV